MASDLNPGVSIAGLTPTSPGRQQHQANSVNHEQDGQNVLYGDGHVAFRQTVFAGPNQDDIFTNGLGEKAGLPTSAGDCVLTPFAK
ncbi:MAG: hypothetical protein QM770_20640 [Tepidisphaeraceae bacterium]